jgi:tetratricopeptide (TPR) repeat protein
LKYFTGLGWIEFYQNNIEDAILLFQRALQFDSSNTKALEFLGECYLTKGQYDESLKYFQKWFTSVGSNPQANLLKASWLGYLYWQNGYRDEAEYYFDAVRNNWYRAYEVGRYWERYGTHYVIAGIRVLEGNCDEAIAHLKIFSQKKLIDYWWLFYFKNDPCFDPIRNDQEFKQIESDVEASFRAEHEKVRMWLEEQGMI